MKNKLLQFIQAIGLIVSAVLLAFTIFWKSEIKDLARDFINERIEPKATFAVDLGEELLRSPKVRNYLGEDQLHVAATEIALYRQDPQAYIQSLTDDSRPGGEQPSRESVAAKPIVENIAAKVISWKQSINRYFNEVFEKIILDLRIFSSTNIVAFIWALWLSAKNGAIDSVPYWIASAILTGSILYSSMMYIDQNWFFTILLDSFMGIAYPIAIAIMFGYILYRYSEIRSLSCPRPPADP